MKLSLRISGTKVMQEQEKNMNEVEETKEVKKEVEVNEMIEMNKMIEIMSDKKKMIRDPAF